MGYLVHLQKFEGPMGLLLYLVRKEEMDIFDIDIHKITTQYLDYIRLMKELDLEVAGEFVAMAATLIHIKSRLLLPSYNEEGEIIDTEDPRKELVQKLLEYQRYQEAGKKLYDRPLLNRDVWNSAVAFDFTDEEALGQIITEDDGLFSLISSYRKAIRKMTKAVHNVRAKVQSISTRVMEIKDRLIVGARVTLRDIIARDTDQTPQVQRAHLLITFLSLLELGRMGFVHLFQNETYGDIHIETVKPIEGNVLERVQEFESEGADEIANSLISEANDDRLEAMELAEEEEARAAARAEQAHVAAQMSFSEEAVVEQSAEQPIEEIASDEEILAAELELPIETNAIETAPTENFDANADFAVEIETTAPVSPEDNLAAALANFDAETEAELQTQTATETETITGTEAGDLADAQTGTQTQTQTDLASSNLDDELAALEAELAALEKADGGNNDAGLI